MKNSLKAEDVRALAQGRWIEILGALAGDILGDALSHRLGTHVTCPFHGGQSDFRFDSNRSKYGSTAETGAAICSCGQWKDGFALLQKARGWTFREALHAVAEYLGMDVRSESVTSMQTWKKEIQRKKEQELAKRRQREIRRHKATRMAIAQIRSTWDESMTLGHPRAEPARRYLAKRGLSWQQLAGNRDIRFHPDLICFQKEDGVLINMGRHPCLLALIRDSAGRPITLHRTYLTATGGKLPVKRPKKIMSVPDTAGRLTGGAIRLFRPGRVLGVAEGIETAMAVQFALGIPTWSCISASLLAKFQAPSVVNEIHIWADRDRSGAGQEAARTLYQSLRKKGLKATVWVPDFRIPDGHKGIDWADVWSMTGILGFPNQSRKIA